MTNASREATGPQFTGSKPRSKAPGARSGGAGLPSQQAQQQLSSRSFLPNRHGYTLPAQYDRNGRPGKNARSEHGGPAMLTTVIPIVLMTVRMVLRGVLPYPDLLRRTRVRSRARDLATRTPWPQDETTATSLDFAQLALLRLLWLQRETRRAVRTRQREAAALLARASMETCILGLWCLHNPTAASKLRTSEFKTAPAMLTFLSSTGLIPDTLLRQAVRALGEPEKLPDVRSMASQVDAKTSATLAIHLYDQAYRPASQYFTHATSSSLLRHVTHERRRIIRPANSWVRRAPVRLADACVGLLAGGVAERVAEPSDLFLRYAEGHAGRVLPPLLATIGKGMARKLSVTDVVRTLRESHDVRTYLSRTGPDDAPVEREARLRNLCGTLIARLDLDLPSEAIQPIIDHFVAMVLAEWDAEVRAPGKEVADTAGILTDPGDHARLGR